MALINGIGRIGYMKGGTAALWKDEDIADVLVAEATDWIGSHQDQPFFLLFNLANDPAETRDLAADEPARVEAMARRLDGLVQSGRSR